MTGSDPVEVLAKPVEVLAKEEQPTGSAVRRRMLPDLGRAVSDLLECLDADCVPGLRQER